MISSPRKLRPPQMWWIIDQQARRRRAGATEDPEPAPKTAQWLPPDAIATWHVAGEATPFTGDLAAFLLVDPTTVTALDLNYSGIISLSGLENLTALEALNISYLVELAAIPALPASLASLQAVYSGLMSLPDFTTTPNIIWINLHYSPNLESEEDDKIVMMQQLDTNGLSNGFLDIGNFSTAYPGATAAVNALHNKGWEVLI